MDADVEMVSSPRRKGSFIVPAEDLDMSLPSDFMENRPLPGTGRRTIAAVTAAALGLASAALAMFYVRGDTVDPTLEKNKPGIGQTIKGSPMISPPDPPQDDISVTAAPTVSPVSLSMTTSAPSFYPIKKSPPDDSKDIEDWLNKTITLADGIQYEVVGEMEHDPSAFIEGLSYGNGVLYESTGLNGASSIRINDAKTGKMLFSHSLDSAYFGEGLTYVNGELFHLTYKKKTGFIFNASDFGIPPETFHFETETGEGWGLTYDPTKHELVVSDGSKYLHFWNADTAEPLRKMEVKRQNNVRTYDINELEYWRGRILANVWHKDIILVINPETGIVEKEYDFTQLWPKSDRKFDRAGVLNGISVSEDPDVLYITGKNWKKMFLVKLF